jgi:fructose-bisphosphate aldolase class II
MLANLQQILGPAMSGRYGVAAFNAYGYEEARAFVDAAEEVQQPIILSASMTLLRFMPLPIVATMLTELGDRSSVQIGVHLDHGPDLETVFAAIDLGFTSVMYDGSDRPLEENIADTRRVVDYAHSRNVSVEAAIGSIPEPEPCAPELRRTTRSEDAARMVEETGVDALAIAIGSVHHMTRPAAVIDYARLHEIESVIDIPIVMHGCSGIFDEDLRRLSRTSACKFNLATSLRRTFGQAMRRAFAADAELFDRIDLMKIAMQAVREEARDRIAVLGPEDLRPVAATPSVGDRTVPS